MEAEDDANKGSDEEGQLKDDEIDAIEPFSLNRVACHFFGSFYNDRSIEDPCVELLSYSQPVRLTEIRVIPLGATVVLSSGVPQLGSTNPEKFDLDFYYQDATEPTRATFRALPRFSYQEKASIQLICHDDENPIFTTKLLVKGFYNSLTLATYGLAVEPKDVPVKPAPVKLAPAVEIKLEPVLSPDMPHDDDKDYVIDEDIKVKEEVHIKSEPQDIRRDASRSPEVEVDEDVEMKDTFESREDDLPQAIPTITTRVNFTATKNFPALERRGSKGTVVLVKDPDTKVEPFSSDEDLFDEPAPTGGSPVKSTVQVPLGTDDIGAEDISDGEISSGSEDVLTAPYIPPSSEQDDTKESQSSLGDDRSTLPLNTTQDRLSDQESEEYFAEPAVEEILSDEELPDYPDSEDDFDLTEYEEAIGDQFGQTFSLDSFKIPSFKNFSIESIVLKSAPSDKSLQQNFMDGLKKYSKNLFEPKLLESWIQFIEQLLPVFNSSVPVTLCKENSDVLETICFWVQKGIDIDSANTQTALTFNIRHIKAGLKLIHCVCGFSNFLAQEILEIRFDESGTTIQHKLFQLLTDSRNDTPVIQNLILKAFDATLSTIRGYTALTDDQLTGMSVYEQIVDYVLEKRRSKRFEFSFAWFLRKVNVIRFLVDFEDRTNLMDPDVMINGLGFLIDSMENVEHNPGYPLRFLPAQTVLEIPRINSWNCRLSLVKILKECHFITSCCSVLGSSNVHADVLEAICRICSCLLTWETGLIYLCEETSVSFWKLMTERCDRDFLMYFAHCLQVVKCADALSLNCNSQSSADIEESMDSLHNVYLALASQLGRKAITRTFSIENFILPLVQCIKDSDMESLRDCDKLNALERSTMNEFAVDLLCFVVKTSDNFQFLRNHGSELFRTITSLNDDHEGYEKLNDLLPFLRPTLDPTNFTLDGIDILSEVLKTKLDLFLSGPRTAGSHWGFTPEVVTILRILNGLGLAPDDLDEIDDISVIPYKNPDPPMVKEMKYTMGFVRMHSADIVTTLSTLLSKIIKEFEQPALYAYAFVKAKGDALVSVVLPIVRILRKILTEVIQVRNTSFRDMTQVPLLLQTYAIFDSFPSTSVSVRSANKVKQHIIGALQAYTTPVMKLGEESEQELTKSIWTLMVSEIIKFTLTGPFNFIPGLSIMSELLPLPLPVFCSESLDEQSEQKLISLRRMWSAFLHGVSAQLQELIGTLCETAHPELMTLLRRTCLQLADLSPSTCLVVCRAIMDPIVTSIESDLEARTKETLDPSSSVTAWVEVANDRRNVLCSARTARLLGFLATLMRKHGVIKAGVMHAFRATTKTDEKFVDFMSMLSCILANCPDQKTPSPHISGQVHVLTIFHSLCNMKLNMLMLPDYSLDEGIDMEYFKANTLPMKDNINLMSTSLLAFLNLQENILGNVTVIRKIFFTLNTFCDTEYGFFHLRAALARHPGVIYNFLVKLKAQEFENLDIVGVMESLEVVDSILRFLMILISPQLSRQDCIELRRSVLSVAELRKCLAWPNEVTQPVSTIEGDKSEYFVQLESHPLTHLQLYLKKVISSGHDASQGGEEQQYLKTYMIEAQEKLNVVTSFLGRTEEGEPPIVVEVSLIPPDSLADLFSHRPVIICSESPSQYKTWNTSYTSIDDADLDRSSDDLIPCDLMELSKMYLSNIDILRELEIAANLESHNDSQAGDTGPNRDIHVKPRPYDLLAGIRSGPASYGHNQRKMSYNNSGRGVSGRGGFGRGMGGPGRGSPHFDPFRSRPPNTSRPPSLHVDDFVALESSGQGSGNSSGYNKGGRSNEPYRGRGPRGSSVGARPFNTPPTDRGRSFRSSSGSGFYSQQQPRSEPSSSRSRGMGNRTYGSGNERWQSNESRGSSGRGGNFGGRQDHRNYDRSSSQARGSSGRQSYGRGNAYRDGPGSSGGARSPGSSGNSNTGSSQRWRDKPRQFNR